MYSATALDYFLMHLVGVLTKNINEKKVLNGLAQITLMEN